MKRLITLIVGVLCTAPWSVRAQFDDAAAAQLQKLVQAYRYVDAAYVDSLDMRRWSRRRSAGCSCGSIPIQPIFRRRR